MIGGFIGLAIGEPLGVSAEVLYTYPPPLTAVFFHERERIYPPTVTHASPYGDNRPMRIINGKATFFISDR